MQKEGLPAVGNTATLINRLLETLPTFVDGADPTPEIMEVPTNIAGIDFQDESDPDFEFKEAE